MPLSTQVYKWVSANLLLGVIATWLGVKIVHFVIKAPNLAEKTAPRCLSIWDMEPPDRKVTDMF